MNTTGNAINTHNLTGQVVVPNFTPEFMGNYSCVYKGMVHGQLVFDFLPESDNNTYDIGR
jgi:hypothetical protein